MTLDMNGLEDFLGGFYPSDKGGESVEKVSPRPLWWSSDEWGTPPAFFDQVNRIFGPFDLDPCCRPKTAKAPAYLVKADPPAGDGLTLPWFGRIWVNPPYSAPATWVRKAITEVEAGNATRVVMLLPAAVDTKWFHDLVLPNADVHFIRGRIKFLGWEGTPIGSPKAGNILATFPKIRLKA